MCYQLSVPKPLRFDFLHREQLVYTVGMAEQKNESKKQMPWWRKRKKHPQAAKTPLPVRPKLPNNYAFIDSQNLNLGVQKSGWKMDWHKFREWLRDEYDVTHAYMFIGYISENEMLYQQMYDHGFLVVLKPTLEIVQVEKPGDKPKDDKDKIPVKGNIDADLVLHAMKELPNYDKAIIVSGDGDFYGLAEYLEQQGKLLKIMAPNSHYSSLLKQFDKYILNLDTHRRDLSYHISRRSKQQR